MRVASGVIGLIGSVAVFVAAIFAGAVSGIGAAIQASGTHELTGLAVSAWGASILGLIAAIVAFSNPRTAWWLLLIAAIWSIISISAFGAPGGILLAIAALLAFLGRGSKPQRSSKNVSIAE